MHTEKFENRPLDIALKGVMAQKLSNTLISPARAGSRPTLSKSCSLFSRLSVGDHLRMSQYQQVLDPKRLYVFPSGDDGKEMT